MKVRTEDGVTTFTIRQSWWNTFLRCPESARREMLGLDERRVSDAMAMGTATHAGIESLLQGDEPALALLKSCESFDDILSGSDGVFEWVQQRNREEALTLVRYALMSFYSHVLPTVGTVASLEQSFRVELDRRYLALTEDWYKPGEPLHGEEVLELTGTWDMANTAAVIYDWKTANREWSAWEPKRYYVQPTIYNYAYSVLNDGELPTFKYIVLNKTGKVAPPQIIPVKRSQSDFDWMKMALWNIVDLYKSTNNGQTSWPLLDQGWHCSPKWCDAWSECKGKAMGDSPW